MPAIHISIAGRVQGVGFRWFARETARRLGLSGWVRNCADGTVEIAAAGESDALASFREAMSRGPGSAHVSEVRELDEIAGELDFPFAVKR